ncbi:MAG: hypothetical protein D3924_03285 [Candidatus Electrothrix sp. AR4]|nr:hypothetical protein [Candidatus Electrothrix sp. AR4]
MSFAALLGSFSTQSFAEGEGISIHHRVVSIDPGKTKTSVTLDVTVGNFGSDNLYDIILTFNENGLFIDPASQGLYISSLETGEETTSSWEITSHANAQIQSFLAGDLLITGAAFGSDAQSITIQVNSQGGA